MIFKKKLKTKTFFAYFLAALLVGDILLISEDSFARGRGGGGGGFSRGGGSSRGSVRQSNMSHRNFSKATPGRSGNVSHPGTSGRSVSGPGRSSAARAGSPRRRTAYRADRRYSARKDARRDYYRFRTINSLIRIGARIIAPPLQTRVVIVSGTTYYYAGGVYYIKSGPGYVVVSSPRGAVIHAVPTSTTVVYVGSTPYYYYGGTYYVVTDKPAPPPQETTVNVNITTTSETTTATSETTTRSSSGLQDVAPTPEVPPMIEDENSYEVVAPPIGATVPYLPEEAGEEMIDGKKHFVYEGTYYRPFSSDGETIYMVVGYPR